MQKLVAVLGGGLAGLSACYHLSRSSKVSKILLLEGGDRFGGWLSSIRRNDGAVFECGPRGVRPAGPVGRNTLNMLADIAIDSLCRGVFAGDCRQLSMRSCFPPLFNAERTMGSIFIGMVLGAGGGPDVPISQLAQRSSKESWTMWSLRRGMQTLPEALVEALKQAEHVDIHRNASVKSLTRDDRGWEIQLEDGTVKADHIISALPAQALAPVLPPAAGFLSQLLLEISMVSVVVVNLEYEGSILPLLGFGHLVPSSEDSGLLGVVYDSVQFPQHNRPGASTTRLTVMMGGAWFQEEFGAPEDHTSQRLLGRATRAVSCHLGVTAEPLWSSVAVHKVICDLVQSLAC
nr:protoporphyrinogen oxidase isoform X2 [Paramormyrops kingsleyae]